jgi:hypothetical protein
MVWFMFRFYFLGARCHCARHISYIVMSMRGARGGRPAFPALRAALGLVSVIQGHRLADSCGRTGSIKDGAYLEQLSDCEFRKKDPAYNLTAVRTSDLTM